jgi:import inner membrane translocase subunit TIM50
LQYYEVVVFTDQLSTYGDPILERLDPSRTISYRLYRDATQYTRGEHARDLAALNRDLSRVVFVGANPGAWMLQPENALPVKAWGLEKDDTVLLDLMPFLESMVRRNVPDTRAVLRSYAEECAASGKDVPTIFRERSAQVATWLKSRDQAPRQLPLLRGRGAKKTQEAQQASSSEAASDGSHEPGYAWMHAKSRPGTLQSDAQSQPWVKGIPVRETRSSC